MPLYDYQCRTCQKVNEVRHGFKETYAGTCADCGGSDLARVFNPAPILFKGSGFYVTDSRRSSSTAAGEGAAKPESKPDAAPKSDATKPDAPKPDAAKPKSESSAA